MAMPITMTEMIGRNFYLWEERRESIMDRKASNATGLFSIDNTSD